MHLFGVKLYAGGGSYVDAESYPITVSESVGVNISSKRASGMYSVAIPSASKSYDFVAVECAVTPAYLGGVLYDYEHVWIHSSHATQATVHFCSFEHRATYRGGYGLALFDPGGGRVFSSEDRLAGILKVIDRVSVASPMPAGAAIAIFQPSIMMTRLSRFNQAWWGIQVIAPATGKAYFHHIDSSSSGLPQVHEAREEDMWLSGFAYTRIRG